MPNSNASRDLFRGQKVSVRGETFAVVKSRAVDTNAFASIADGNEITVIVDQDQVNEADIIEIERDWRLLTFEMVLPFGVIGFLAGVSAALAEAGISIFALSAYSTDHILVKQRDLTKAKRALQELGFTVEART